jgi:hypothetical protein
MGAHPGVAAVVDGLFLPALRTAEMLEALLPALQHLPDFLRLDLPELTSVLELVDFQLWLSEKMWFIVILSEGLLSADSISNRFGVHTQIGSLAPLNGVGDPTEMYTFML